MFNYNILQFSKKAITFNIVCSIIFLYQSWYNNTYFEEINFHFIALI